MRRRAFLSYAAASALTCGGGAWGDSKSMAKIEHLGRPCRARNVHAGVVVEDGGREWFVISNTNETANMELIFIDPKTDTGHVYRAPAGSGAWALEKIPGNRLMVGTYYDGMFMIFDVAKREWVKTLKFPGEDYIWTLAEGKDGRLYGGTYPGGKLGALDPETFAFEDLGAPGKPNLYLRQTSALPDGRIFCQFGYTDTKTMVFDPATKVFAPAPEAMQGVTVGVSWNGFFLAGDKAFRMPDLASVDPLPFPAPDSKDGVWAVDARLSDEKTLILRQGVTVFRYRPGDAALTKVLRMRQRGAGSLLATNENGEFFGIRGQDYFTLRPNQAKADLRIIPGEASPRATHFLTADDRGRLWGGPTFGQTLFYLDTRTGKLVNTRTVSDYGGEVYDAAVIDGICYAVAYAGGEVIRFDPDAPWDQVNHVNPKTIARVGPEYIRPQAGVHVGPDGRLYSGWLAKYGVYGGALSITDPETGKTQVFKDPLGPRGVSALAAIDENLVLLGTTVYGNGLGNKKDDTAHLGLYDLRQKKAVHTLTILGAGSIGSIAYDPATRLAVLLAGGKLYRFDLEKRDLTDLRGEEKVTGHGLALKGKRILYSVGKTLLARDLPGDESQFVVATLPSDIHKLTVAPDGIIFVACGADVYRITE